MLLRGAPALARSLLEQADRVAVAAVEVLQLRLLHGGRQRDDDRLVRHGAPDPDRGDGGRVADLCGVERHGARVGHHRARRRQDQLRWLGKRTAQDVPPHTGEGEEKDDYADQKAPAARIRPPPFRAPLYVAGATTGMPLTNGRSEPRQGRAVRRTRPRPRAPRRR